MRRLVLLVPAVLLLCVTTAPAPATGQITVLGATIASGAASATKGNVVIDACAPDAPGPAALPAPVPGPLDLGALPAAPPAFPTDLPGGAPFVAAVDTSLSGGTIDASSFTVGVGRTVTFSGPVTIRTTGDVTLGGALRTTAADASITILCGGNFTADRPQTTIPDIVSATGARSDVTIDVAGNFTLDGYRPVQGDNARRIEAGRDVRIVQHLATASAKFRIVDVLANAGSIDVLLPATLEGYSCEFSAPSGDVALRAYASNFDFDVAKVRAKSFIVDAVTYFHGTETDAVIDGPVSIVGHQGAQSFMTGQVIVTAAAPPGSSLRIAGETMDVRSLQARHRGTGEILLQVRSHLYLLDDLQTASTATTQIVHEGTGDVHLQCQNAYVRRHTLLRAEHGDVQVELVGETSSFRLESESSVEAPEGAFRATAAYLRLWAGSDDPGFGPPSVSALAVELDTPNLYAAQVGPVSVTCGTGGFRFTARQAATLRGTITSAGPIAIANTYATLDLAGVNLSTTSRASSTSRITIQNFSGPDGVIDLTGATVRTGDAAPGSSGSIVVAVRSPGEAPAPAAVDGCLVPSSIRVTRNTKHPERSKLVVKGAFDMGAADVDLGGSTSVTLNGDVVNADLARDRRGVWRFGNPVLAVQVVPPTNGSSRNAVKIVRHGDVSSFVDAQGSGTLDTRLATGGVEARSLVLLANRGYVAAGALGQFAGPALAPLSARATLRGEGADYLECTFQFAPELDPVGAPAVSFALGPVFAVDFAAAEFTRAKAGDYRASRPADGIGSFVVDRFAGTVKLQARGVELGLLEAGAPIDVRLTFDGVDARVLRMRLGAKGRTLVY